MDQKTKRILMKAVVNLCKLLAFSSAVVLYSVICLYISHRYSGNIFYGLAAMICPLIVFSVWDQSKNQVETELYKEENTLAALSRKYE